MRFSKSLFVAFAGLGLFACSNEDVTNGLNDNGESKSIVIKLDGLDNGGRAIGAPTTESDKKTTTMSDVAILLSDGTKILGHQKLDATSDATEWNQLKGVNGYIMHEVNNHVREVHVIGNYSKESTVAAAVNGIQDGTTTLQSIKDIVIKAAQQQTFDEVTLYGSDVALTSDGTDETNPPHDGTSSKMLLAEVTVNHLVSRIEIGNIQCTDLGTMYKQIDLKYIGLLNYYNQTTLAGTGTGTIPMTLDNVLEPTTANANPGEGKFSWSNTNTDAAYKWAWDAITGASINSSTTQYNPSNEGSGDGKFVYQFIPTQVGSKNFQVKLYVDAKENTSAAAPSSLNTVTANFTGDTDFAYEPGKIYKLDLIFSENNIGPWNPDEVICVKVKVTVADWTIKTLTPTFE